MLFLFSSGFSELGENENPPPSTHNSAGFGGRGGGGDGVSVFLK